MNPGSHLQNNTFKCVVIIFALVIIKVQSVPFSQNSDENSQETEMKVNISDSVIPAIDSIGLAKMESLEDTDTPEKDTKSVIGLGLQYLLSLAQKEEQKLSSTTTKAGETDTAITEAAEDYIEIDINTTPLPQMRKSTLRTRRRTTEKTTAATTELLDEELEYEDEPTTTTPTPPKVPTKEEATDAILDVINVAIMFSQSGGTIATTTPTQRNRIRTRRTTTTTGSPEDYYYEEPEETTTPKRRRPIRPRSTLAPRTTSTVVPESTTTEKIAEDYNYVVETEETTTQRKRRPVRPRTTLPASTTTEIVPTTKESVETEKTEKIPEDYNYVTAESEETTTRRRRPVRPRSTLPPRKPTTNKVDIETTENKLPEDYEYVEEPQETTTRRRRRRTRPTMTTSRTTRRPEYNPEPITAWAGTGDEDEDEDEHDKPPPGVPAAVLNNIQKFIVNVGTANVSGIVDQSLKIASLETVGTVVNTIQSGFLNLFGCSALDQLVGRCKIPPSG